MKSLLNYFGNKSVMAQHFPPPRSSVVCEPFAGGAGYSLHYETPQAFLIDKNEMICRIWHWLINASVEDIDALPGNEPVHPKDIDAPEPARDLVSLWQQRGAAHRKYTCAPASAEKIRRGEKAYWGVHIKQRLIEALPLIRKWDIYCGDWVKGVEIAELTYGTNIQWYVDPPYIAEGARLGNRYTHGAKALDFNELGEWCKRQTHIIVSESDEAEWLPFQSLPVKTQNQNSEGYGEAIWMQGMDDPMFEDE